ncbi:AAA family ATPase [Streptomyces sp. NPDC002867]
MRPLTLTFSGLRSYPGTCGPLDFTGKRLVGILGDTGAGKSTLLEAMTAALYGKCSWSERDVSDLIAENCPTMSVDFVFSVNGESWRVLRVFHANTKPSQALLENLRTGKTVDNVRGVDHAIRGLLGLDYKSFMTAVLLPQGRFDTLLNATDSQRTAMLKSIFGVEELHTARRRAEDGRSRLLDLVHRAELARRDLLEDPRGEAEAAQLEADKEAELADQLQGRLEALRVCQQEAIAAQARVKEVTAASNGLAERQAGDVDSTLAALQQTHDELEEQQAAHDAAYTAADKQRADSAELLATAKAQGHTPATLTAAQQLLHSLPQQLADLTGEQTRLTGDRNRLAAEDQELADAATAIEVQQADVDALEQVAQHAQTRSAMARQASDRLQEAVRSIVSQAATVAGHRQQADAAKSEHERLIGELHQLTAALDLHRAQRSKAENVLAALRRNDAAHTAGQGLSGGDTCPVCSHTLQDDYGPPPASAPEALAAATDGLDAKAAALTTAIAEQKQLTTAAHKATSTHEKQLALADEGQGLLEARLEEVRASARELAVHAEHAAPDVFAQELAARTSAVAGRLADGHAEGSTHTDVVAEVKEAAQHQEQALARAWSTAHETVARVATQLEAARRRLDEQHTALTADLERLKKAEQRTTARHQALLTQLRQLPLVAREALPGGEALPDAQDTRAAVEAVAVQLQQLEALVEAQAQAESALRDLAQQDKERAQRRKEAVTKPLQELSRTLSSWAEAAAQAAGLIAHGERPALPQPGDWTDPAAARSHAGALTRVSETLHTLLDAAAVAAQESVTAFERDIAAEAIPGSGAPVTGPDLFSPALLDPLTQQAVTARTAAEQALARHKLADSQIAHADQLDTALAAGKRQHSAWDGLYRHLTDAKFPAYLTELRTRSLLGVGSALLDELSGGKLGFAENFRIVNRRSGIARSPKTLSGGETFQASLALSLALVELHSRSSTHIESLFLDEGFGTLDTAALDSALSVLRTHVGSDKLLAVISHLHPVAETVDDVLWVEKQALGSQARWLTIEERNALIRDDVSGLTDLT